MPNNVGAFGENFPYSNQHDMNQDWIIKIVKDFLDQYTGLQQTITDSEEFMNNAVASIQLLLEQIPVDYSKMSVLINNITIPDNYPGTTDTMKLQNCIDSLESTGGIILINRTYTLNDNIYTSLDTNYDKSIIIMGIGSNARIAMTEYSFMGTIPGRSGGLWFMNLQFTGTGNAFDVSALIRMRFFNCYFIGFNNIFYGGNERNESKVFQSLYVDHCTFRRVANAAFNNVYNAVYDVHITNCLMEAGGIFFKSTGHDYMALLSVTDCCIEGCDGVFKASPNQAIDQCVFNNNYFEDNDFYFDLSEMLFSANMSICDNMIAESASVPLVDLPTAVNPTNGWITVERNTLADKTAQTYVFGFPVNATAGNYKGLIFKNNRFNHLTNHNNYNNLLTPDETRKVVISGTDFANFVENALKYFIATMPNKTGQFDIQWQGQGNFTVLVTLYTEGQASAIFFNVARLVTAQYNGTTTTMKEATLTSI